MPAYDLVSLKKRFDRSPFTRWFDLKPISLTDDSIALEVETRPEMQGSPVRDVLHGGVLTTLIDVACSFSLIVRDGGDYMTVDLRTDFHRGCGGGVLRVYGSVVRRGSRLSTTEARVEDENGVLIASGRGVFMAYQPTGAATASREKTS